MRRATERNWHCKAILEISYQGKRMSHDSNALFLPPLHPPNSTMYASIHLSTSHLHPVSLLQLALSTDVVKAWTTACCIHRSFFGVLSFRVASYLSLKLPYSLLKPSDCFFKASISRSFAANSSLSLPISPAFPAFSSFSPCLPPALGLPSYLLTFSSRRRTSRIIVYVRLRISDRKSVKPQRYMFRCE